MSATDCGADPATATRTHRVSVAAGASARRSVLVAPANGPSYTALVVPLAGGTSMPVLHAASPVTRSRSSVSWLGKVVAPRAVVSASR